MVWVEMWTGCRRLGSFLIWPPEAGWNLVVIDGFLSCIELREFLRDLLDANSLLHTAVISDMGRDFLDSTAELGVLCAVPGSPTWEDGVGVMDRLCLFHDLG